MVDENLMAPQRLSARTWLRAAILRELLISEEFITDLSAALDSAEDMIAGQGGRSADRLYARFAGWRQARAEGVRLEFVMVERMAQISALILAIQPDDEA